MTRRAETTAATRAALLGAAAGLLRSGGPDAVTLREVGARAGVSRQAAYRHFADKEALLGEIAAQGWDGLRERLPVGEGADPRATVRAVLHLMIETGRADPHLYRLMFTPADRSSAVAQAAMRAQATYLELVSELVGEQDAWRIGGLMIAGVHGLAGLESSGFLTGEKWPRAEELVDLLVDLLPLGD